MRKSFWIACALLCLGTPALAEELPPAGGPLTVIRLEAGADVSRSQADTLTALIAVQAARGLGRRVVPAPEGAKACRPADAVCLRRETAGSEAEAAITGSLTRTGERWELLLWWTPLAAEDPVGTGRRLATGPIENLVNQLPEIVAELAGTVRPSGPPPPPPAEPEPADGPASPPEKRAFYKGDLTTIGPVEIIPEANRAGVVLGYRAYLADMKAYLYLSPELDLRFGDFSFGLDVPLQFEAFSWRLKPGTASYEKFGNFFDLRTADWDEWRDWFKIVRYIRYGRKEDRLYVNLNRSFSSTVGHGETMRYYVANVDPDQPRESLSFDMYNDYAGFQFYANDITRWTLLSTLAFVKPAAFFSDNEILKTLSLGLIYSGDLKAPQTLKEDLDQHLRFRFDTQGVHILGGDAEIKVYKDDRSDIKTYAWYAHILDAGGGFGTGLLGRYNIDSGLLHAFRLRTEFRTFADNFVPAYFDSYYEIQKFQYVSEHAQAGRNTPIDRIPPTKRAAVFSRSGDRHYGFYAEFSYALVGYFGMTLALEDASGADNGSLLAHIEVPATKYLRLAATYWKYNFDSYSAIFKPGQSNSAFYLMARGTPLPFFPYIFINGGWIRTLAPAVGPEPNYDVVYGYRLDLEFAYEF